jgi:G3E family GTPase
VALRDPQVTAILLEGLPDGHTRLLDEAAPGLTVVRIAPGCICCSGNLPMRVHLNRLLRQKPQRLFLSIASTDHLAEIRRFLSAPPYEQMLVLTNDIHA